jgi:hypothetical protein
MILFISNIFSLLGSGPQWKLVESSISDPCKKYWWRNLLFMQNYFGTYNICMLQSHYITTDSTLFMIAPLLTYILWKIPKRSILILVGLIFISYIIKACIIFKKQIPEFVHIGTRSVYLNFTKCKF